jgi:hypothetical protein
MSTTPPTSPLLRGAAVTLALLSLGTYVFVTSCTRAGQRDRPAVPTQAAATATVRGPASAPAPPATAASTDNAPRPATATNEPSWAPPAYLSATKAGVMHLVPRTPTTAPAPQPAPQPVPQPSPQQQAMQQPSPQQKAP